MPEIHRKVDIGFGKGRRIENWVKDAEPHHVIEGVEYEPQKEKRIEIEGATLHYDGFLKWLDQAPDNAYHEIHADFFFDN